jgi:hypothetical protein
VPVGDDADRVMDIDCEPSSKVAQVLKLFEEVTLEHRHVLYHNQDGSGAFDAVKFAGFKPGASLTWSDFLFF